MVGSLKRKQEWGALRGASGERWLAGWGVTLDGGVPKEEAGVGSFAGSLWGEHSPTTP